MPLSRTLILIYVFRPELFSHRAADVDDARNDQDVLPAGTALQEYGELLLVSAL